MTDKNTDIEKSDPQAAVRAKTATRRAVIGLAAAIAVATGAAVATYYVTEADAWVGTVNGERIGRDDYTRSFELRKKQYETRMGVDFSSPGSTAMLDNLRKDVVDQLVERSVLLQGAKGRKVDAADAEVETRLKTVKTQFPSEDAFKKALQENGVTVPALQGQIRDSLIVEKLRDDLTKAATVSAEEAKKFYTDNPDHFKVTEEVKAAHILVKTEDQAKGLAAQIKAGADFADLARKHSEDTGSKAQGGDLGFFGKGRMVPEFEKAAFALGSGKVSKPIQSQFGWHIIKVSDRHEPRKKPYDEIKAEIMDQLLRQKRDTEFRAWLDGKRAEAKIVIRPQYLPATPPAISSPHGSGSLSVAPVPAHGADAGAATSSN